MSGIKQLEQNLRAFLKESLEIESIFREPTEEEFKATWDFIQLDEVKVADLCYLVYVYQPDAKLRLSKQDRVWVGGREAPEGSLRLGTKLSSLCKNYTTSLAKPRDKECLLAHQEYEYLHPFTNGNGRSGRALWANLMFKQGYDFRYRFLQIYYYQTLSKFAEDKTKEDIFYSHYHRNDSKGVEK